MQTAHAEAEEASDSVAEDFLNKRIDNVDEFLDQFLVSCFDSSDSGHLFQHLFFSAGKAKTLPFKTNKGGQDEGAVGRASTSDDVDNASKTRSAPARRLQPSGSCRRPDQQLGRRAGLPRASSRGGFAVSDQPASIGNADVSVTPSIIVIRSVSITKYAIFKYYLQSAMEINIRKPNCNT